MRYCPGFKSPWIVQVRDHMGRMHTKRFRDRDDAVEWEAFMVKRRQRRGGGLSAPIEPKIFFEGFSEFMISRTQGRKPRAGTTIESDESRGKYWVEAFGKDSIDKIGAEELHSTLEALALRNKWSAGTWNRHRALLSAAWKFFMKKHYADENVASRLPTEDESVKVRKTGFWETMEEVEVYIQGALDVIHDVSKQARVTEGPKRGEFLKGPKPLRTRTHVWWAAATFLSFEGPRSSELFGLQWQDVNFETNTVTFRRIREKRSGLICERTKSKGAPATVPLFSRVREALLVWRALTPFTRPNDFVFHDEMGRSLSHARYYLVHKRIIRNTKLKYITPHDIRRTFATNAEKFGYQRGEVQKLLRHKRITTTEAYIGNDVRHLAEKGREFGNVVRMRG